MKFKTKLSSIVFVTLLLSLVVNIVAPLRVAAEENLRGAVSLATVNVKVQKLVDGEKPKPGEVFEFEISLDSGQDFSPFIENTQVTTDENGEAVFVITINRWFPASGDRDQYSYTIREINVPEGYTAMNDAHFDLVIDTRDGERIDRYINDEEWYVYYQDFYFEATPNTINNVTAKEETPEDPQEEVPASEIKPPASGILTRSFIAVAAVLTLGYTAYRLNSKKVKE